MALDVLKGLTPVRKLGSGLNNGGMNYYPIANGLAETIGEGDPVKLSAGVIQRATNNAACLGVFAHTRYVDSDGKLQIKNSFVTGTSSKGGSDVGGGYLQPLAAVYDDPSQTYVIRTIAAASVSAGMLGRSFKVSAIGSVVGTRSQAVLDVAASAGASGGHMVTIIGLYTGQDSEWGTAPTAVEVKLSNHGIVGEL